MHHFQFIFVAFVGVAVAEMKYFQMRPSMEEPPMKKTNGGGNNAMMEVQTAAPIRIISMKSQVNPDGTYAYMYETENGIQMQEQGFTKQGEKVDDKGKKESINVAQGSYSYTSPEGVPISVSYIADENGFQTFENEMPETTTTTTNGGTNGQPKKMPPPPSKMKPQPQQPQQRPTNGGMKAAAMAPPTYYAYTYPKNQPADDNDQEEEEDEEDEQEQVYPTPNLYRY